MRTPKPGAPINLPVDIRTNAYGNIPRGAIKRALAKPNTFIATRGNSRTRGLVSGIYQRQHARRKATQQGRIRLLIAFEQRAPYQPRFGFRETALRTARQTFIRHFNDTLHSALPTAR